MQNPIVKNILACFVLVVLCFIVGSLVTESYVASSGVLALLFGMAFMLFMGTRSWMLIFLLAPLIEALPLPGPLSKLPGGFLIAACVLGYWALMWLVGHARFRWRSLGLVDVMVLVLVIIMVSTYIRRPVIIAFLGMEGDNIGGAEYIRFLLGIIYYVALSCIPVSSQQLARILNISVVVKVGVAFVLLLLLLAGVGGNAYDMSNLGDESAKLRIGQFQTYGTTFALAIFSYFSLQSVLINPFLLVSSAISMGLIVLGGSRNHAGLSMLNIMAILIIKREVLISIVVGAVAYAMLLVVSLGGGLNMLPFAAQRVLAMMPGLQVSNDAVRDGNATWDWRENLWGLAWDKRTGYIKNYVFGDGYGLSQAVIDRGRRAYMRGETRAGEELDGFATSGIWHNGVITVIHRIGYVGLVAIAVWGILGCFYAVKTCCAWRGNPLFSPLLFYVTSFIVLPPNFIWGMAGESELFYHFVPLALIKVAYCMARDEGRIEPLFRRRCYQPLMIREHGERIHSPLAQVR